MRQTLAAVFVLGSVIPAQAGTHAAGAEWLGRAVAALWRVWALEAAWVPACAGMTEGAQRWRLGRGGAGVGWRRGSGLGAGLGEIPAASAGMTELSCAGMTDLGARGMTELGVSAAEWFWCARTGLCCFYQRSRR